MDDLLEIGGQSVVENTNNLHQINNTVNGYEIAYLLELILLF